MFDEVRAHLLLDKCVGDEIWSIPTCQREGVPPAWILELSDCFESGYDTDRNTIYVDEQMTNQYEGVRDRDLAFKICEYLGHDPNEVTAMAIGRKAEVRAIREYIEEQ